MNRRIAFGTCLFLCALFLGSTARAQDPSQQEPQPEPQSEPQPSDNPQEPMPGGQPKPAGYSFPGVFGPGEGELQDDFSPLTGFQNTTLGFPEFRHSFWVPGLQYASTIQTTGGSSSSWYDSNYFLGNMSLLKASEAGTFAVNYSGGGYVSSGDYNGAAFYQQLALAQNLRTQRWLFQVVDQFAQSPQSAFGFGGGTSLGIPGTGGSFGATIPGLGGSYVPNQSVYGVGPFIGNTGALQATYAVSRRGSITVAGSYGILHFTEPGNIDTNAFVGSVGYNYALSRKDTVGLVYRYSDFQYPGSPQAYSDHVVSVAYGRKVTGRLGFRIFAGPEYTQYRHPIGTSNSNHTLGFSVSAQATYGFRRSSLGLTYDHGLYGGSGVLIGSVLDQATAFGNRSLTRVWSGNVTFGYARNAPVGGTSTTSGPTYSDWFIAAGVNRPIGRSLSFSAAYTATVGNYGGPSCVGTGCSANNYTYNTVTLGLQWRPRPFILQ